SARSSCRMVSRSSTKRWRSPTPSPRSRLLGPALRPLRQLADHAGEVFPLRGEPVGDAHRGGWCHLAPDDAERLELLQPVRKERVRDGRHTFLQVRVPSHTAEQPPKDLWRPALPEHVGRHPVMAADGALFLKAHGVPSLVLVPQDAIGSTLGIGKGIPKPKKLWNTEYLRDRYRSYRAPQEAEAQRDEGGRPMATTETKTVNGISIPPAGRWEFDRAHTAFSFVARHMLSKARGLFPEYDGSVEIAEKPEDSEMLVELNTAAVTTGNEMRDGHLNSGDFFLTERYPTI